MYSYRIEQAIRAAAILHHDQVRKGSQQFPYITHLISVAFILLDYTDDEDVIIAALLHDTVEDTDYTLDEVREDFGAEVATLVDAVTEERVRGSDTLNWLDRKKHYAEKVKRGPKAAAMIAAADKIHNFRTLVEEYYDSPERFLHDFGSHLDDRIDAYQTIANAINHQLDGPLLEEFNHVFARYKEFIYDVKQHHEKARRLT